jgi:hypothetical protein
MTRTAMTATAKPAALRTLVGVAAIVAPALHTVTDAMEWYRGGFTAPQLWLNYAAFLPMPWLLLGVYATCSATLAPRALVGAVLYGVAFTYFAHTTLFALALGTPDYELLWERLGVAYTAHGALMVIGGLLFASAALRSSCLPRGAVWLFGGGLCVNLLLALLPAPDLLQTVGTAIRNAGLIGMGYALLRAGRAAPG